MPEEAKVEIEVTEDNQEQEAPQVSAAEEKALSSGWMPEEDWIEAGNDPDDWVDAKTFNRNGEFMSRIHKQRREIDELKTSINELKRLQGRVAEQERKKVIDELKRAKAIALEQEDYDTVVDIDERMDEVKHQNQQPAGTPPGPDPIFTAAFNDWVEKNPWYTTDPVMQKYADKYGIDLAATGMSYKEVFAEVSEHVKEKFSHKFKNPAREKSSVDGGNRTGTPPRAQKQKYTFKDLPEEAQKAASHLARTGVMSKDDYVKDYFG
jgi:hypothetical protein